MIIGQLLLLAGLFVFIGTILAPPSLKFFAWFFKWLFWDTTHYTRPQPAIGPAKSLRVQNKFVEALAYLETLAESYPDLSIAFIEMMDIYSTDLKDMEKTVETYKRARRCVKGREERQKLEAAFKELMEG